MAYPTALDTFTDLDCNSTESPKDVINDIQDAVENIETYVGVENSAVAGTITYDLTNTSSLNPGHKHTLADGATDVTASASELNYLDGVSPGTAVASKAVVLDANKNFNFDTGGTTTRYLASNMPTGFMSNGQISRSVTSNNLTVSLLTAAGGTPSATDPVYVTIAGTRYSVTSALTLTRNAGTNWFDSGSAQFATFEVDYFVYLGVNSGAVFLAFATVPYGAFYSDFSSTTTNPLYMAASVTPAAGDPLVNIGRFNATLSATASFNWSVPATSIIINRPIFFSRVLTGLTGATGFSALTTNVLSYKIIDDTLFSWCRIVGTSNATGFTYGIRYPNIAVTGEGSGVGRDSGTAMPINLEVAASSAAVSVYRSTVSGSNVITTTTWTASGDKRANGFISTPIR